MTTINLAVPVAGVTAFSTAAANVDSDLTTIQTWANGNVDGANVDASLTGRRLLFQADCYIGGSFGTNTLYGIQMDGSLIVSGGTTTKGVRVVYLDPAKYAVVGKANTQLMITLEGYCGVNPGVTVSAQLNSASFSAASPNVIVGNGSLVAGGAALNLVGNGSSSGGDGVAAACPAAGFYLPIINLSGTTAANSATWAMYKLWVFNN